MKDVIFEKIPMAPEYRRYENDITLTSIEEFSHTALDPKDKGEGDHLRELIGKVHGEFQKGVGLMTDLVVAVGRKP